MHNYTLLTKGTTLLRFAALTLSVLTLVAFIMPVPAYADDMSRDTEKLLDNMIDTIMVWYNLIRTYIAVPLLILSFATCGFKFWSNAFRSKGEFAHDEIMGQVIKSGIALLVILFLPVIMVEIQKIVRRLAWEP